MWVKLLRNYKYVGNAFAKGDRVDLPPSEAGRLKRANCAVMSTDPAQDKSKKAGKEGAAWETAVSNSKDREKASLPVDGEKPEPPVESDAALAEEPEPEPEVEDAEDPPKRKRGRPRKIPVEE